MYEDDYFKYGKKEIDYLKKKDQKLGKIIEKIGIINRDVHTDIFSGLIISVIGQQISTKAATTVTNRLEGLTGTFTPENIDKIDEKLIQKCGMSLRKASYIKGIARSVMLKDIDLQNLYNLSDDQVIEELIKLKGIGEWTAEMLLIHSLQRPDVLSYKDLGIRRGIMKIYGLDELSKKDFEIYRKRYSPYGTVASFYLWEISSQKSEDK